MRVTPRRVPARRVYVAEAEGRALQAVAGGSK